MPIERITAALLASLTLTTLLSTGCQPFGCHPTMIETAEGEAEAGYTADELSAKMDGDHEISGLHSSTGETHVGSVMLTITSGEWQRWVPDDNSVESCPDTQLILEADFDLVIGDIDISGTFAGESLGPDLARFHLYVSESLLAGGVDVVDEGYGSEGVLIDVTVNTDTDEVSLIVSVPDAEGTYEPLYD